MRQAERIRYLLLAAQREGNRELAAALNAIGLSPAQSEVLRILGDHGSLTVTGVGRMLVCDVGTNASRLIERLVRSELVERIPDPTDRRQVRLKLTTEGLARERQTRAIEDAMYAQIDMLPYATELEAALEVIVAGRPTGNALQRRIDGPASADTDPQEADL